MTCPLIEISSGFSCDFNKYTIRVIKKMSLKNIDENVAEQEENLLLNKVDDNESEMEMSADETSEE